MLAKSSKVFEEMIYNKAGVCELSELEMEAVGGSYGIEAFKLFLFQIYGRTIKWEALKRYRVLANLAGFAKNYKMEDIKEAAIARMAELVENEEDFEILTKLSSLASKFGLQSLATSTSTKIQTVITQELNTSVLAKFNSLEVTDVRDKIKTLSDLAHLGSHHNVTSLKSAVAAHLEAVEVNENNFADLVEMADSTQLMAPLRKALARYIRVNYVYTEELAYFIKR